MLGSVGLGLGSVPLADGSDTGGGGTTGGYSLLQEASVIASPTGASSCVFAGALIGDVVIGAVDLTGVVEAKNFFEAVVTVNGRVQQTAGFPGANARVAILLGRPA